MLYLSIDDRVTKKAVIVFYDSKEGQTVFKIYTKLRMILWHKCNSIEQLDKIVDWMINLHRVHNISFRDSFKIVMNNEKIMNELKTLETIVV